jgi:nuclear GTP-binding protein
MRVKSSTPSLTPTHSDVERISKRVNSRQRHRIEKKVSEHHRKSRKEGKKNLQWKSKRPRDLGVPNSFPFKEKVIAEQEEVRRLKEEERKKKKAGTTEVKEANEQEDNGITEVETYVGGVQVGEEEEMMEEEDEEDEDEDGDEEMDTEEEDDWEDSDSDSLSPSITSSESEWEGIVSDSHHTPLIADIDSLTHLNTQRNTKPPPYLKPLHRSDLLIFVLDARAPAVTRARDVELWAAEQGKKCVFVIARTGILSLAGWVG